MTTSPHSRSRLDEVVSVVGGGTPSKRDSSYWEGPIPWVSPKDMKQWEIVDAADHVSAVAVKESACKLISPPAVLIVVRGMILAHSMPVAISRVPVVINQDMKALIPRDGMDADYLAVVLAGAAESLLKKVEVAGHGTRRLPTPAWSSITVPVRHKADQRRIVRLVYDVMERVTEIARLRSELEEDAADAFSSALGCFFPASWPEVALGDVVSDIRNGWSGKEDASGVQVRVLRLSAVHAMTINPTESRDVRVAERDRETFTVNARDLFVVRGNGSKHLVGRSAIAPETMSGVIFNDLLIRVQPKIAQLAPEFLNFCFALPRVRAQVEIAAKTAAGIWKINQGGLASIRVPCPPMREQLAAVAVARELRGRCELLVRHGEQAAPADIIKAVCRSAFLGEL